MLTKVYEYDGINQLTFHIMLSPILSPLAKTAYLAISQIVFCKFYFSVKCLEVKTGLK